MGATYTFTSTRGLVSELEQELEPEAGKFLTVVKDGPPWAYSQSICQCALQAYMNWRNREVHFPPYIAYLGLFVLAGGADGDFSPNAYYPRLQRTPKGFGSGNDSFISSHVATLGRLGGMVCIRSEG